MILWINILLIQGATIYLIERLGFVVGIGIILIAVGVGVTIKLLEIGKKQLISNNKVETSPNLMVIKLDAKGKIVLANHHARKQLGYDKKWLEEHTIFDLIIINDHNKLKKILADDLEKINVSSIDLSFVTKSYTKIYTICILKYNIDSDKTIEISAVDIAQYYLSDADKEQINSLYYELASSEEEVQRRFEELGEKQEALQKSEERMRYIAYYDDLTGMTNKNYFKEEFDKLNTEHCAIVHIDIDNFKIINDSFGHLCGDLTLIEIGKRLQSLNDENIRISRIGADEFVVLVVSVQDKKEVNKLVKAINGLFDEPIALNDVRYGISVSMGVAMSPADGLSVEELLMHADTAMHKAKEQGKRKAVFFNQKFKDSIVEKIHMESNLRSAIKNNEFELYYQPQTTISTGEIKGFEALIRWKQGDGTMIPPFKFISVAEETGLMIPIGEWVLREACLFINQLKEEGYDELYVAVNISVVQLAQDNFVEVVERVIEETGVNPARLHIEITETMLMESIDINIEKINKIKKKGVLISLDDFGKGYSSLAYLKQLPINVLKIEKAFIDDILENDRKNITGAIINLGHELELEVVAEGVEEQSQFAYLQHYKCDMIQGYLISKPIPKNDVFTFLREFKKIEG